ncbi:hypothetical protein [uncultured Treponema sp.]|uniref:hypothetical protein n=1 Tax=uncultured Treponema sp. TaxID=162155 RepID=UPI0025EB68C4|nr:hypothetical protein [uncultured Treponema sp.]
MFTATKIEAEILKILNQTEPLKEEQIIKEICKNRDRDSAVTPQVIQNALEGCTAKGFVALTSNGIKITDEGKKQI